MHLQLGLSQVFAAPCPETALQVRKNLEMQNGAEPNFNNPEFETTPKPKDDHNRNKYRWTSDRFRSALSRSTFSSFSGTADGSWNTRETGFKVLSSSLRHVPR